MTGNLRGDGRRPRRASLVLGLAAALLALPVLLALSPAAGGSPRASAPTSPIPVVPSAEVGSALPSQPSVLTLPWSGGLDYVGTNTSGVETYLGNVTIPAGILDRTGYNYTVGLGAADASCTFGTAGLENSGGFWRFAFSFTPYGSGGAPVQGWSPRSVHLAPGDTYQLVLLSTSGNFVAGVFNATAGSFYDAASSGPFASATYTDGASGLLTGPSTCAGRTLALEANLTVRAVPAGPATGPSRDLFVENESLALSSTPFTLFLAPNLWTGEFDHAPSAFAPAQSWATSDLVLLTSTHPSVTLATVTAPPSDIDVGGTAAVGVVGTPVIAQNAANANTYAFTQVEFGGGYTNTTTLAFATCHSTNGTNSNPGYPGNDPGIPGEYDYSVNTTLSDIFLVFALRPAVNLSLDDRCFTQALRTPGNLTVWALSYLQYVGTDPSIIYVDALSSGPREQLGMNALRWNVWVHPLPNVTTSTSTPVVLVNQPATFDASERGGAPPLTTSWYVDGTPQGGCSGTSCTLAWSSTGTHQVWSAVVDAVGHRAVSGHVNATVDPGLSAVLAPGATAYGSVGSPSTFTATAGGGAPGYGYAFWVNGSAGPVQQGAGGTLPWVPSHPALYQVWVAVNDSLGNVAVSPHTNLSVSAALVATLLPSNATAEVGGTAATLTAGAVGGSGTGYTFAWQTPGLTPSGPCGATCILDAASPGTYAAWVLATDSQGRTAVSAHTNVTVVAPPAFVAWTGPTRVDQGSNDTFSVQFSGGAAPFTYGWTVNGSGAAPWCAANATCSLALPAPGPVVLQATLVDALAGSATSTALTVQEVAPLTVALLPRSSSAEVGVPTGLAAVATQGVAGYAYGFLTSSAPGTPFGAGPSGSTSWTPSAPGVVEVWAEANDSTGFRAVSPHLNVTVAPVLTASLSPAPSATVATGVFLNATLGVSGGDGNYTYVWLEDGGTVVGTCTGAFCLYRWTAPGTHPIWAVVGDGLGGLLVTPHTNASVTQGVSVTVAFQIAPANAGSLVVAGNATASGTLLTLLPGPYALQATPLAGFSFVGWNLSSSGGMSLGNPALPSTTLLLTGGSGGTVMAEFRGSVPLAVAVAVSPAGSGSLTINGTPESDGASGTLVAGVYPLAAVSAAGYLFLGWVGSGGVSTSSNFATSLLIVGGNGTITLEETSAQGIAPFTLALFVDPAGAGGTVQIDQTPYQPGTTPGFAAGTYRLTLQLPPGYTFRSWRMTGGVTVQDTSSASTNLTLTGNATLTAELTSKGSTGFLGLSTLSLEIILALVLLLVVLIAVGAARHRAHARARPVRPWEGSSGTSSAAGGATEPMEEDDGDPGS